ncbi:hypothetical protein [Cupriavidus pinatubonensis]|uniref:Uncharacterized protein n=1 Tax=Cupriavidus pinatubonensis TaxID=248026 RepID=A0ABN7YI46_9BURK|nr:hypothetical protein [Cupriavidus pinatubonensis]CAG9172454.1 hypothetical protein LMG23994_02403 [Cupriavidus pinatubonensis]
MTTHTESQEPQPRARTVLRRARRAMILLRVLGMCANSVALAQGTLPGPSAVTPEQKFPSGYLEAVATGYDNGQAMHPAEGMAPLRPRAAATRVELPAVSSPMGQVRAVTTAAPAPAVPAR